MCTAMTYQTRDFYFGRTLDYERGFGESVTITPRYFAFPFCASPHHAIIGMAHVANGYPLYYDAVNECGLCAAGLNFVGNACYHAPQTNCHNVAHYDLIPYLLCRCATVSEVKEALVSVNITDIPFSAQYPVAQLHWIVADKHACIVLESVADGLHVYDNPVGVLTNNPPFSEQLKNWKTYQHLTPYDPPYNGDPRAYSRGRGAIGLPGDVSSSSRFVRAAFVRQYARSGMNELDSVGQFFHNLGTVEQVRGICEVEDGEYELTRYTSCCNATRGVYYYTTYQNRRITAVAMRYENVDGAKPICYPLLTEESVLEQNSSVY